MVEQAKILVVDDQESIRFYLEEMLERDGYEVVTVETGEEALAQAQGGGFDLALVDLRLPGITGLDVLTGLREEAPDTVVIMLTGHGSLESAVEALRQGAHDYLFKPCKTVEIRASVRRGLLKYQQKQRQRALLQQLEQYLAHSLHNVRATIDGATSGDEATLEVPQMTQQLAEVPPSESYATTETRFLQRGPLIVDFVRHVITLNGHLLELSPTEFDLLAYLISESPRVISPEELIREVQGYECEPWEARDTVRYHIYRLRQKIKDACEDVDVIRTVRGVGYTVDKIA